MVVRFAADELVTQVADDGGGEAGGMGGGRGLAWIRERVAVFSGQLEAGRRPDGGWTLRATFRIAT